jgi:hypothetical protein
LQLERLLVVYFVLTLRTLEQDVDFVGQIESQVALPSASALLPLEFCLWLGHQVQGHWALCLIVIINRSRTPSLLDQGLSSIK